MKSLIWMQGGLLCVLVAVLGLFLFRESTINIDSPIHLPPPVFPDQKESNTLTYSIVSVSDSIAKNITVLVDFTSPSKLTVHTSGSSLLIKEVRDDATEPKTLTIPFDEEVMIYSSRLFPFQGRTRLSLEMSPKGD